MRCSKICLLPSASYKVLLLFSLAEGPNDKSAPQTNSEDTYPKEETEEEKETEKLLLAGKRKN